MTQNLEQKSRPTVLRNIVNKHGNRYVRNITRENLEQIFEDSNFSGNNEVETVNNEHEIEHSFANAVLVDETAMEQWPKDGAVPNDSENGWEMIDSGSFTFKTWHLL